MGTFRKIYFAAAFVAFVFLLVSLLPTL